VPSGRTKNQEQRTENKEQRTENQALRAIRANQEPKNRRRAESQISPLGATNKAARRCSLFVVCLLVLCSVPSPLFVCSFVVLFVRLFLCSFVPLFRAQPFVRLFFRRFVRLFLCSFVRLFVCSFVPLFVYPFVPLFLCSFIPFAFSASHQPQPDSHAEGFAIMRARNSK
jgi:hypothetical protein